MKKLKSWEKLEAHFSSIKEMKMRDMFVEDSERFNKYSLELNDILYDFLYHLLER